MVGDGDGGGADVDGALGASSMQVMPLTRTPPHFSRSHCRSSQVGEGVLIHLLSGLERKVGPGRPLPCETLGRSDPGMTSCPC